MIPSIMKRDYSFRPNFQWKDGEMKSIGERFLPIMFGSIVTQMTVFIERFLASGLGDGKISALKYAFTIYQLPMAIFVAAFTLPIFPYLVEYFKKGEIEKTKSAITEGMQYLFILMTPTIVAIVVLAPDFVSAVYQWGGTSQFDDSGVWLTSQALIFYSLGLFFLAARDLLTRAFYAMENTMIPVICAVISILVFVVSSILLIPYLDHAGIALGTSVGSFCNMLLLAILLRKKIGAFIQHTFWHTLWKTIVASIVMALVLYFSIQLAPWDELFIHKIVVGSLIVLGAALFGCIMLVFKERKVLEIIQKLKRR